MGIAIGARPPGPFDAIIDVGVPGARVGQVTIARGTAVNTGVTAIVPTSATCSATSCAPRSSSATRSAI
jgi:L-aminopeptidase/D-esterase-like protein